MAVDKEMLEAISQMLDERLTVEHENMRQMLDERLTVEHENMRQMLTQSEKRIIARMDKSDKFLEDCINEAANDSQLSIQRHEKEWHSA